MQCNNCKTELPVHSKLCPECGMAVPGGANLQVQQDIGSVKGDVAGIVLGQGNLPPGLNSTTTQKVDTVESGGTLVGTVVGGKEPVHVGGQQHYGDSITVGDITDSTGVGIGNNVNVNINQSSGASADEIASLFAVIYQKIQAREEDPDVNKEELTQTVQRIEQETLKGEQANPGKMNRWLKTLAGMASDIGDVVIAALTSPALGLATVVRKVAEKARTEAQ